MSKTTTLHAHHNFCQFLCRPCTATRWNGQILSSPKNGSGKAINSAISVWTRARVPSLHFHLKFPFLSNRATWDNREIVSKYAKCIFQRRFHGRRGCRIVRSLLCDGDGLILEIRLRSWDVFSWSTKILVRPRCIVESDKRSLRTLHSL